MYQLNNLYQTPQSATFLLYCQVPTDPGVYPCYGEGGGGVPQVGTDAQHYLFKQQEQE